MFLSLNKIQAICAYPDLLQDDKFPNDVKERAERILNGCGGKSVGMHLSVHLRYVYFI